MFTGVVNMGRIASQLQWCRDLPASLQKLVYEVTMLIILLHWVSNGVSAFAISSNISLQTSIMTETLSKSWPVLESAISSNTTFRINATNAMKISYTDMQTPNITYSGSSPSFEPWNTSLPSIVKEETTFALPKGTIESVVQLSTSTLSLNRTTIFSSSTLEGFKNTTLYSIAPSSTISSTMMLGTQSSWPAMWPSLLQSSFYFTRTDLPVKTTVLSASVLSNSTSLIPFTNGTSYGLNSASSVNFSSSTSIPVCPGSSSCATTPTKKSKDFLNIMLGVGIGAAVLFFVIFMAVFICMRRNSMRKPSRHYKRSGRHPPEKASDELLESKESVFNSSTLHLGEGVFNSGLEMEMNDSRVCILSNSPKDIVREGRSSTFRPQQDIQPEPLTVHVSMEQVDKIPTGIEHSAMFGLSQELVHDASLRLLQDWQEEFADSNSEQYQELKYDVESSIKYIYKAKQGFKDVKLETFRKGSVVANISLILLAIVKNPLEILKKSVSQGRIGNLSVDKHFSVTRSKDTGDSNAGPGFDKRQPYMQRILSKGSKRNSTDIEEELSATCTVDLSATEANIDQVTNERIAPLETDENDSGNYPTYANIQGAVVTRKSSLDEINSESAPIAGNARPTSLVDLGKIEPIRFRDQRDSGIGSMQELNRLDSSRVSRYEDIPETSEQVFYDIPEGKDMASPKHDILGSQATSMELKSPAEQGIAHVALFDFTGKDSRELNMKQGELLYVCQKESLGWVKVVNSDNRRGWVPTSFLVQVSQSQLVSTQQTVETLEFLDNVLDQLDEESGGDLSAASTPEMEVYLEPVNNDDDKNNHEYVTIMPEDDLETQAHQCKTTFAFTASDQSEMSFEVGEIITVLRMTNTGWWKGNIVEREGWFPSSYVMPLKDNAEGSAPELTTNDKTQPTVRLTEELADSLNGNRPSEVESAVEQPGGEAVIYAEPEISTKHEENNYQSLQRQFRPPENYAHLYLQILKRESKADEEIEKDAAAIQVKLKAADPERPLRMPPVPPRDEALVKPDVPPRHSVQQPIGQQRKQVVKKPQKPKVSSTPHGEPPKRPVPPPPTAKPAMVSVAAARPEQKDEIIFLDKGTADKVNPASKTKYENVPEKPKRSKPFITKENIKHPIIAISLKDEMNTEELPAKNITKTDEAANLVRVSTEPPAPPAKPSFMSFGGAKNVTTSKHNFDSIDGSEKQSEPKLSIETSERPSKPLPRFQATDIPVEDPSVVVTMSHSKEIATSSDIPASPSKPLQKLQTSDLQTKDSNAPIPVSRSKEIGTPSSKPPFPKKEVKTSRPSLPQKPKSVDVTIKSRPDSSPRMVNRQESSNDIASPNSNKSSAINDPLQPPKPELSNKPSLPNKPLPTSIEHNQLPEKPLSRAETSQTKPPAANNKDSPSKSSNITSTASPKLSKPQTAPKAKPLGFTISKEELLIKKASIDQHGLSKLDHLSRGGSQKLSDLVKSKGNKTPPKPQQSATNSPLVHKSPSVSEQTSSAKKPEIAKLPEPREIRFPNADSKEAEHDTKPPVRPATSPLSVKSSNGSVASRANPPLLPDPPDSGVSSSPATIANSDVSKIAKAPPKPNLAVKPVTSAKPTTISAVKRSEIDNNELQTAALSSTGPTTGPVSKKRETRIKATALSGRMSPPNKPLPTHSAKPSPEQITKPIGPVAVKRVGKQTSVDGKQAQPNVASKESLSSTNGKNRNTKELLSAKEAVNSTEIPTAGPSKNRVEEVDDGAQNAPIPVPRSKSRTQQEKQEAAPKAKPERPSSPPVHESDKKDKPDRPPPPTVQSPKLVSPKRRTKDTSKLRKVVKSYSKTSDKELDLVVGDTLFELASEISNCYGLLENGQEGWYPADHVVAVVQTS